MIDTPSAPCPMTDTTQKTKLQGANGGSYSFTARLPPHALPEIHFTTAKDDDGNYVVLLAVRPPPHPVLWRNEPIGDCPALYKALYYKALYYMDAIVVGHGSMFHDDAADNAVFTAGRGALATPDSLPGRDGCYRFCAQIHDREVEMVRLETDGRIYVEGMVTDDRDRILAAFGAWAERMLDGVLPKEIRP